MQKDIHDIDQRPEEQAESLIGKLYNLYADYIDKNRRHEEKNKSIAKLFEKWIRGSDSSATDSMHQEFLDTIDNIVSELITPLNKLQEDDPDLCSDIAEKGVRRLMAPKLGGRQPKTNAEWYMTVVEYQCAPLLPYLNLEVMESIRGEMFKVPKRMMFPKEKEFFEKFEEILEAKRKQSKA